MKNSLLDTEQGGTVNFWKRSLEKELRKKAKKKIIKLGKKIWMFQ